MPKLSFYSIVFIATVLLQSFADGQEVSDAKKLYYSGEYDKCIATCKIGIENAWQVDWRLYKIKSELKLGLYKEALVSTKKALDRHSSDIRVYWLARTVYRFNDEIDIADSMVSKIELLAKDAPWRYSDAEDKIVLGKMLLDANSDARQVLEFFFDSAKRSQPGLLDNFLVAADLALSKNDYDLAAKEAQSGLKLHPENAELHFRLSQALWNSDRQKASLALEKTLKLNPKHDGAILVKADNAIDNEDYDLALELIEKILEYNPSHDLALAHMAIIAHLKGDFETEKSFREQALETWSKNPNVDHVIGKKLSQKYRFKEGVEAQRRALAFRPDFVPAKIQLAQDLLRLGKDEEGWALVSDANKLDEYNTLMHNLQTLNDEVSSFKSLKQDGIVVRMSVKEANLYGPEVLKLLVDAKQKLCEKYDYKFTQPVFVEIFPRQSDFAIRTFGMPGGAGFLGVCFGHLITANSPASQTDNPVNWQSVLWHEFCHAVTLGKTNNRMPRWLSEGISVYEERLRNPGSGERISPMYRQMMLSEDLTPVSQLSAAFLQAKSPMHLQFAYYESSMVVEYIVEEYGIAVLRKILVDLGAGIPINESLQRYAGSLKELDEKFKTYATQYAESYAAEVDFSEAEILPNMSVKQLKEFLAKRPNHFEATIQLAATYLREKAFTDAKEVLTDLRKKFGEKQGNVTVLRLLARIHQSLGEIDEELKTLSAIDQASDEQLEVYKRIIAIQSEKKDWQAVRDAANRILAINPLQVEPYRILATAGEQLNDFDTTSRALECLLEFGTTDIAATHYRIAKIRLAQKKLPAAKRHVLQSLEEAPRYRDALELLLEINVKLDEVPATQDEATAKESALTTDESKTKAKK